MATVSFMLLLPVPSSSSGIVDSLISRVSNKLLIKTSDNKNIFVNNFYSLPSATIIDEEKDVEIIAAQNYSIVFYAKDSSFNVALLGNNLIASRNEAETVLVKILGIAQVDTCRLTVSLGVPYFVSPDASGVNYNLSYCRNGVMLPHQTRPQILIPQ